MKNQSIYPASEYTFAQALRAEADRIDALDPIEVARALIADHDRAQLLALDTVRNAQQPQQGEK